MINVKNFISKIKTEKKIVILMCSILLVFIILMNSTYSLLVQNDETDVMNYTTGILEITSEATNNSVTLTNSLPMTDADGAALTPYTFKITNTGNLNYEFDVKLLSTTTSNQIDAQYIKVKVNNESIMTLSSLTDGIISENITLAPGESIEFSLRVWLDENTPNSQIGKEFNGKVTTEGYAVYTSTAEPSYNTLVKLGLDDEVNEDVLTTFESTSEADGTLGIYEAEDDLGTSYYFRGNVTNNYVKFGKNSSGTDMYWRIIRINGDGSIRMIYDGTQAHENGTSSSDRQVGTSVFNTTYLDNAFVGYMNGTTDGEYFPISDAVESLSYEEAHANTTNSTIKTYVDNWYKTNIVDTGYSEYVVDAIYCNNRKVTTNQAFLYYLEEFEEVPNTGFGRYDTTIYGFYDGVDAEAYFMEVNYVVTPSLKCPQENDKFTKSPSIGNGKLTYPVGLITTDEAIFAGGHAGVNSSYYLYTGESYWTVSPDRFNADEEGLIFIVDSDGSAFANTAVGEDFELYIRPVISIAADAIIDGTGSPTAPFIIEYE